MGSGEDGGMSHIKELRAVIRRLHGVESSHVASVPVKETFQGRTVWEGVVEVFDPQSGIRAQASCTRGHMLRRRPREPLATRNGSP